MSEASASLAQLRSIVEDDWARRRRRRGRTAAVTEGTNHASLIVMETLDAYLAAARVRTNEQTNERTNERKNEQTNERTNKPTKKNADRFVSRETNELTHLTGVFFIKLNKNQTSLPAL